MLVKAAAGGGEQGISVARSPDELREAFAAAAREAEAAFGDPALYIEKLIESAVTSRSRCWARRRRGAPPVRARVLAPAPSPEARRVALPGLHPPTRDAMTAAADRLAAAVGYVGAGTVEFLVDQNERFYFIEMNTRLQVEHGVTEMVTGIDLVRAQLLIAAGEAQFAQDDIRVNGSAIEFRINAEDPAQDFHLPGADRRRRVAGRLRGAGRHGDLRRLHGRAVLRLADREADGLGAHAGQALRRGRRALREFRIEGIATTVPLHMRLVDDERVRSGDVHGLSRAAALGGDAAAGLAAQVSSVSRMVRPNE